jgi:hypothetical protein
MSTLETLTSKSGSRHSTEWRIARLRQRIVSEREVTRATVLVLTPKLDAAARLVWRLKGVPALAARYAPLLLPMAGVVFRKSPVVRNVMRFWGLAKLAKAIARSVLAARQREIVEVAREVQ